MVDISLALLKVPIFLKLKLLSSKQVMAMEVLSGNSCKISVADG